jgi:hypothetical protein
MIGRFWQNDDPLLKLFFEKYQLNLLSIPRENVSLGDVYTQEENNKRLSSPSNIVYLLEPKFEFTDKTTNETLADISGTISKGSSIDSAFQFLEGILNVLGIGSIVGASMKAHYQRKGAKSIKFNFPNTTRDHIDPNLFLTDLGRYHLKENALYDNTHRYFIVTGIVKSSYISMIAEDDSNSAIEADVQALGISNISANLSINSSASGTITFKDNTKKLVFGVELYELEYHDITKRFRLKLVDKPYIIKRDDRDEIQKEKVLKPIIIGDQDDLFITIS